MYSHKQDSFITASDTEHSTELTTWVVPKLCSCMEYLVQIEIEQDSVFPVSFMEENKQKLKLSFPSVSILPTLLISSIYNPVMLKYEWIPRERWVGSIIFC